MKSKKLLSGALVLFLMASCVSEQKIGEMLKKNPKLITDAIKENPAEFMTALQDAARTAREEMAKRKEEEEKKQLEEFFNKPLKPNIEGRTVRGSKDGQIVLVEYSDFQCPYCTRGFEVVSKLLDKYKGKVKFVYKHLPLSFHKEAMPAAIYFEAIALQSADKAWKFHDAIFANQSKLSAGEKFLKVQAKKAGANMKKLAKDVKSEKIISLVKADMEEAAKFGIQGTPGFLLNGIPIKGAYPIQYFEEMIAKLQEKGKLSL